MSLPSKVVEVVDKAVMDAAVADVVDLMPTHRDLFLKKKLTR
jgi:hypothetical protein